MLHGESPTGADTQHPQGDTSFAEHTRMHSLTVAGVEAGKGVVETLPSRSREWPAGPTQG